MTWRAWTTFAILCVIWGVPYFFIKLALNELSPVCIAWGRITLAAVILVPIAWHRGVLRPALAHKAAVGLLMILYGSWLANSGARQTAESPA